MLLIKKGTASYHNNYLCQNGLLRYLGSPENMSKEESAGALQRDFTLELIYLERDGALSYTLPDGGAGQGYAGWLKLSTGACTATSLF